MAMQTILSLDNPVFRGYLVNSSVLVIKMMAMAPYTTLIRFKYKAFVNPEDSALVNVDPKSDENVERIKRAHLNDLENIPLFFVAGFGYVMTNPDPATALMLFKCYTCARILHTVVYAVVPLPQPARANIFLVGLGITGYMVYKIISTCR